MPVTINGTTGITTPNLDSAGTVTTSNLVNGTALAFRNKIINGNFGINQRVYVSGTATINANQYTLDRWRVVTSGQNLTFSSSGTGNSVTAPAGGIEQVIEALNIEGGTYTLSWIGTATGAVNGSAIANGGQVTLPANTNATIKFTSGTVSLVQLEQGSVVTPFENLPVGTQLALCQRYFLSISASSINNRSIALGFWSLTTTGLVHINLPVQMMYIPTLSISSSSHFGFNNGGSVYAGTSLSLDTGASNIVASLDFSVASGGTIGNATRMYMNNASAKINLTSEF
jgi:hypothetical protein